MKKILFIFFMLVLSKTSNSQITFFNYLDSTVQYGVYYGYWNGIAPGYEYSTVYFNGDTLISGNTYYKQYRISKDSVVGYSVTNTIFGPYFIREDNTNKFFQYSGTGPENVIEDWAVFNNLGIGNSFPNETCQIATIDTLYLGTRPLRRYGHSNSAPLNQYYVEGIGKILPFMCALFNEGNSEIMCYTKQGNTILNSSTINCNQFPKPIYNNITTVKELNATPVVNIYPNPFTNIITLEVSSFTSDLNINIHNVLGTLLYQKNIKENHSVIETNFLSSGIYYITITNDRLSSKKIIIKQ